ncbi:hypothetical protein KM043_012004 [Ampulex compressa]|nr:hypothetical protein KM043_012004 [Ampulex compressa]
MPGRKTAILHLVQKQELEGEAGLKPPDHLWATRCLQPGEIVTDNVEDGYQVFQLQEDEFVQRPPESLSSCWMLQKGPYTSLPCYYRANAIRGLFEPSSRQADSGITRYSRGSFADLGHSSLPPPSLLAKVLPRVEDEEPRRALEALNSLGMETALDLRNKEDQTFQSRSTYVHFQEPNTKEAAFESTGSKAKEKKLVLQEGVLSIKWREHEISLFEEEKSGCRQRPYNGPYLRRRSQ